MAIHNKITDDQIKFISENLDKHPNELALILGKHAGSITRVAKQHNLKYIKTSPKSTKINNSFFKMKSAEMFYILGFIAADGCILETARNGLSLNIELSIKDSQHLEKISKIMGFSGLLRFDKTKSTAIFRVGSREICLDLKGYGISPRKSLVLNWPSNIPSEYVSDFIRGYFDGDGSCRLQEGYKNKNGEFIPQFSFQILGTLHFLEGIKKTFNEICNNNYGSIKKSKTSNVFILTIGGNKSAISFGEFIYNNKKVYLHRKFKRFEFWKSIRCGKVTKLNIEYLRYYNPISSAKTSE